MSSLTGGMDYYKLTMGEVAHALHTYQSARFAFTYRGKENLPARIPLAQLQERLAADRERQVPAHILQALHAERLSNGKPTFHSSYLDFLSRDFRLPEVSAEVVHDDARGERFEIVANGAWPHVSPWETIMMGAVNELYIAAEMNRLGLSDEDLDRKGEKRLREKIAILKQHPDITFADFGTRRRRSFAWQRRVLEIVANELPDQLIGTSNVDLAFELGLRPIGTMAHEMDMAYEGIYYHNNHSTGQLVSHQIMLDDWWEAYGKDLSIALTDTYTSEFFFRTFGEERAKLWRGLRHDSGNPIAFGERAIRFYRDFDIDPREKIIIFSDGLDVPSMVKIANHFRDRINFAFGWGTNLMNDCGIKPISIVMKLVLLGSVYTVKLPDNLAKVTGPERRVRETARWAGVNLGSVGSQTCTY